MSATLIEKLEHRLGPGITPAERRLVDEWEKALDYIGSLTKNPTIDEDKVLELVTGELTAYGLYEVDCTLRSRVADTTLTQIHEVVARELKRVYVDSAMQGFDDDISQEFLEEMDHKHG